MGLLADFVWSFVWGSGLVFAAVTAFNFLDVPLSSYGPYLIWVLVLIILTNVLPSKEPSLADFNEPKM